MTSLHTFDENSTKALSIGHIDVVKVKKLTGIDLGVSEVFIYPGAIKHIKREHPGIWDNYKHTLPTILTSPDYIGKNPKVPDSIELYKQVGDTLLLAIKLDPTGYLFVSSFYDLNNANVKIAKRLKSGRIVPFV